jgi:hypothetical protein
MVIALVPLKLLEPTQKRCIKTRGELLAMLQLAK